MKINRQIVENYLGKKVEIKFYDGEIIVGELHKTGEKKYKSNPNLYIPKNYYFVKLPFSFSHSFLFRSSHIRKIKEVVY